MERIKKEVLIKFIQNNLLWMGAIAVMAIVLITSTRQIIAPLAAYFGTSGVLNLASKILKVIT